MTILDLGEALARYGSSADTKEPLEIEADGLCTIRKFSTGGFRRRRTTKAAAALTSPRQQTYR
jgi:hypothetical protein